MARVEASSVVARARSAPREAAESRWIDRLARYGFVAKGVADGLVGVLAAALALGAAGKATSKEGALQAVASETWGKALVAALAVGFAAYALWRLVQALFDREDAGSDAKGIAKRLGYFGRAVLYGALTFATLRLLADANSGDSQTQDARQATAHVFDWPGGRILVGAVGAILIGAGVYNAFRAFTQKFEEKWKTQDMSSAGLRWAKRAGSVGMLARFVVFSLIGAFFLKAAYEFDAKEAIGLDGALRTVAQASYGTVLLGIVAAGLLCYALHCFVEARYRRV